MHIFFILTWMRERCKIILYLLYFSAKKRMIPSTYLSGFWNIRNCLERAIPATSLLQKQDELTHRTRWAHPQDECKEWTSFTKTDKKRRTHSYLRFWYLLSTSESGVPSDKDFIRMSEIDIIWSKAPVSIGEPGPPKPRKPKRCQLLTLFMKFCNILSSSHCQHYCQHCQHCQHCLHCPPTRSSSTMMACSVSLWGHQASNQAALRKKKGFLIVVQHWYHDNLN